MPMSEAVFEKHDYSKPRMRKLQPIEDYDPRPPEFRGTTHHVPANAALQSTMSALK